MSADTLWAELQRTRAENALLRAQIAGLKAELDSLKGLDGSHRRHYEGPMDPETGRTVVTCIGCHRVGPLRARSMCASCYMRWRRSHGSHGV